MSYKVEFGVIGSKRMIDMDDVPMPAAGDVVTLDGEDFTTVSRQFV